MSLDVLKVVSQILESYLFILSHFSQDLYFPNVARFDITQAMYRCSNDECLFQIQTFATQNHVKIMVHVVKMMVHLMGTRVTVYLAG